MDPADPRVRRGAVVGGVTGAVLGAVLVGYGLMQAVRFVPVDLLRVLAAPAALVGAAVGGWIGARWGRESGLRDSTLDAREIAISGYGVLPLVVDGRPARKSDADRFDLRVTTRRLQLWDRSECLWDHPWSEIRLTTVKRETLVVLHDDRPIAELRHPYHVAEGWDALMLGAKRRGRAV